ncbi:DUF3592 domain-containing protein [Streptomyces chartreusis]|uniref:DUF3592 domain-containing protein n=1 Tax=Streptomyces chartreusis TaxID=1969 RepID=UPI00344932D7
MVEQDTVGRFAGAKAGPWWSGLGFLAVVAVPALWLFNTNPPLRRAMILTALGCALFCVMALMVHRRWAGVPQPFDDIASRASSETQKSLGAVDLNGPPLVLPSRRNQQWRTLGWGVGICTAIIGLVALAAGTPQRSDSVQQIYSAGSEFVSLPAEKVTDLRRVNSRASSSYTATVVVRLPDRATGDEVSATVRAKANDPLRSGDRVRVLYAPSQPGLGAVAGDERSLGSELRGETMPAWQRWSIIALWAFGCCVVLEGVSRRHGFRSFSQLGESDKALRGRYTNVGQYHHDEAGGAGEPSKGKYLEIQTEIGYAHFLTRNADKVPQDLQGQQLWLCWDAKRGTQDGRFLPRRTPAALVFDSGMVIHGMLNVTKAVALSGAGVTFQRSEPPKAAKERPLRLWDPGSEWLGNFGPVMSGLCATAIACAVLLVFGIDGAWRWASGISGVLSVIGVVGAYLNSIAESGATESGQSAARQH